MIAVKVDNSRQPNCRWYSGSGIYRHTWLVATNPLHVAHWGTFVTTPRVSKDAATVQVKTRVTNERKTAAALHADHQPARSRRQGSPDRRGNPGQIAPNDEYEFVQQLSVDKPNLWCAADPYLYKVRSTVREQGRVVDEYDTPIGIREAIFDADRGFLLNGEHVKLNGVCLHHDAGCCRRRRARSACGSAASRFCARWAATPSAPATIPTPPSFWTSATAWASW